MANVDRGDSIIGPTTRVVGNVTGKGGIRVEGVVEGDVRVDGPSSLGAGAKVGGDFHAESLELAGTLEGNAVVSGFIRIRSTAVVHGEMKGSEVSIEEGARVSVVLDTDFDDDF